MRIHMMTPMLTIGDAIGNYILSLRRTLVELGIQVHLYADYIDPAYSHSVRPTRTYHSTGQDVLWFHYSIWSQNFAVLQQTENFKVMDYHGVAPPHLAINYDARMSELCRQAIEMLPDYGDVFDWCIYHAETGRQDLEEAGYTRFSKVRLPVDTTWFGLEQDRELAATLERLEYILFVGRIVPQKDVLGIVRVFAEVHKYRPDICLFLVGGTDVLPGYAQQVREEINHLGLAGRVQMTGKISDGAALTSLYRHAKFLISLSEWESYCVPAIEALFCGIPVIHSDTPPLPENVGNAGVVIDKADPVSAGEQIAAVWDDEQEYTRLQANASRRSSRFTDAALKEAVQCALRDWLEALEQNPFKRSTQCVSI